MGWLVWCILFIILAACILPWWFIPLVFVVSILYFILTNADFCSRKRGPIDNSMPHLQKVKREIEERKRMEAERAKRKNYNNTNGKTKTKESNVIYDAAAIAGVQHCITI